MTRKQWIVVAASAAAAAVVFLVSQNLRPLFGWILLPADDAADRVAFVGRWLLAPGLALAAGVVATGGRRFFGDAIDGTRAPEDPGLEINLRYNQNTLEQVVLAAIAWIGLALALPRERLLLIPVMAILFLVGRATFWIGYRLYPTLRAFGMVLTALPTFAAYAWLLWRALVG